MAQTVLVFRELYFDGNWTRSRTRGDILVTYTSTASARLGVLQDAPPTGPKPKQFSKFRQVSNQETM